MIFCRSNNKTYKKKKKPEEDEENGSEKEKKERISSLLLRLLFLLLGTGNASRVDSWEEKRVSQRFSLEKHTKPGFFWR